MASNLSALAQKIADAIKEQNRRKYEEIYFESLDETLKIHSLTEDEYLEINEKSKGDGKLMERMIYEACDPLREKAKELVKAVVITSGWEATGFLSLPDKGKVLAAINRLSGRGAKSKVIIGEAVEALKNSSGGATAPDTQAEV